MKKLLILMICLCCAAVVAASDTYFVSVVSAKVRSCPKTTCEVLTKFKKGTQIEALEQVNGDTVSKSIVWYRVSVNGRDGFIHSSLVSSNNPNPPVVTNNTGSANTVTQQSAPAAPSKNTGRVPKNCAEAVAMGLTPQEAAQYPKLDRDHDGVACYGD